MITIGSALLENLKIDNHESNRHLVQRNIWTSSQRAIRGSTLHVQPWTSCKICCSSGHSGAVQAQVNQCLVPRPGPLILHQLALSQQICGPINIAYVFIFSREKKKKQLLLLKVGAFDCLFGGMSVEWGDRALCGKYQPISSISFAQSNFVRGEIFLLLEFYISNYWISIDMCEQPILILRIIW